MTNEEFIRRHAKPLVDKWLKEIDRAVMMPVVNKLEIVAEAEAILKMVFADDEATSVRTYKDDVWHTAMYLEIRSPAILLNNESEQYFCAALGMADSIEICASDDELAVVVLEFDDCFTIVGKL